MEPSLHHAHKRGFTVIEMLVVLAIVAILPAVIIANFPQIKLQFALSRAAYSFAQNIRRAQDLSLSSLQYRDASHVVQQVYGYGIYLNLTDLGDQRYLLYADADPENQSYDSGDYIVENIDLAVSEPGVMIKEIDNVVGDTASVNFSPPDPVTTIGQLTSGNTSIQVVFALQNDPSVTKIVLINTSGLVEIQ